MVRLGLLLVVVLGIAVVFVLRRIWQQAPENLHQRLTVLAALLIVMACLLLIQIEVQCGLGAERRLPLRAWERALREGQPIPVLAAFGGCYVVLSSGGDSDLTGDP